MQQTILPNNTDSPTVDIYHSFHISLETIFYSRVYRKEISTRW
jgi:hypothetical protein